MCFTACAWAKVGRIVYACRIEDATKTGIRQIPISFRYSRTAWLYLDRGFDPDVVEDAMLNRARFSWRTLPIWAWRFSFQKVAVLHDIDECASLTGGERRRRRLAGDTGARNVIASTRWP